MAGKQKVALVTGAGSGIGRATALRLAEDGMAVAVVGRSANIEPVVEEIRKKGGEAIAVRANVASAESVDAMYQEVLDQYGHLDCVASNAGIFLNDKFLEMSYEDWDKLLSINLDGAFLCGQKAAEIMLRQGTGGKIAFTLSQGGFAESDASFAYIVSKWAGRGLVRSMAAHYAPYGIHINAIAPGNIMTKMMDYIIGEYAKEAGAPESAIRTSMETAAPLGRPQPAEEMAALYSYLFSDAAKSMVGFTIIDNGAMLLGS